MATDDGRDLFDFAHHGCELGGIERLRSVRERGFRMVVHFDDQTIGACGNGCARHGQDAVAAAGSVAGIDEDRQVAQVMQRGDDAEIERVARVIGKGAHAALAENYFVIAFAHHVLGGHQKLFERGAQAALDEHGLAQFSGLFEQREVLHVARADLDYVGPFGNQFEGFRVERLGDDAQAEFIADFGHDFQGFKAQPLKCVGRGARLVSAATEKLRAGGGHFGGDGEGLVASFDGAGPGDDGQVAAADGGAGAGETDDRVFFFHVAAGEFVGFGDANYFRNAGERFEIAAVDFALISGDADGGSLRAGKGMGAETQLHDVVADRLYLFRRSVRFHDD